MRSKKEIESELEEARGRALRPRAMVHSKISVELLLDIRELLNRGSEQKDL